VTARLAEIDRLAPGRDVTAAGYWDAQASKAASQPSLTGPRDPFLCQVNRVARTTSTIVDVGSGARRFALELAPHVRVVRAVDQSPRMLASLRRSAGQRGLQNVRTITGRWEDIKGVDAGADIVFSCFVLPLVPDARAFLQKIDEAARSHAFLYLGAYSADAILDPLWRHFHGSPRQPAPTYLDALGVLRELGITPSVSIVEVANRTRFATMEDAVNEYRDKLLLPDDQKSRQVLEALLKDWLIRKAGDFRSPMPKVPAAVIRWDRRR
jgi:SAM-dependent methyltransferase